MDFFLGVQLHFTINQEKSDSLITLNRFSPSSGDSYELVSNFSDTCLGGKSKNLKIEDFVFRNFVDDTLIYNVMTDNYIDTNGNIELIYTGLCIDINTGISFELTLSNHYNSTTIPVDIIAKRNNHLLVMANITESTNSTGISTIIRKTGLISSTDFLSSIPDFKMIDAIRDYP